MSKRSYRSIQRGLQILSYPELKRAKALVDSKIAEDEFGQLMESREADVDRRPRCDCEAFMKWGVTNKGLQRFKCKSCQKTFTGITGSPFKRIKQPDKLIDYAKVAYGLPLRRLAKKFNINLKTAFAWRHKLLINAEKLKPTEVAGIVEFDEAFVPESFKGKRTIVHRKSRKRGGGKVPLIPVLIGLERTGELTHYVMTSNSKVEISRCLTPILTPDSVLVADGNLTYKSIVDSLPFNIDHHRLPSNKGKPMIDGIYHIQRLNNQIASWRSFMKPFKGVGTAYLDRYLSWFRYESKWLTDPLFMLRQSIYLINSIASEKCTKVEIQT